VKIAKSSNSNTYIKIDEETLSNICHQLSHDIGNPMTAIISYSSILEQSEHFNISHEKVSSYAKNISRETWRISKLMEKFLLLTSRKLVCSPFPASELEKKVLSRYNSRYELENLEISFTGFDPKILIPADIDQCSIILCEIGANAINAEKILNNNQPVNLPISLAITSDSIIMEARNLSPEHKTDLADLFKPGVKEFSSEKDTLGIGLSAIASAMKRWCGYLEIEEIANSNEESEHENSKTFTFVTRLIFPKIKNEDL